MDQFGIERVVPFSRQHLIGQGGRVDVVLGEFLTYKDATYCSGQWSEAHPNDLRLTREREVNVSGGK